MINETHEASARAGLDLEETARRVATLYGRVLNLSEVGAEDDFFVLGGTSLTALDLLELVTQEFGVEVPTRTFYQATVVRDLAHEVRSLAVEVG